MNMCGHLFYISTITSQVVIQSLKVKEYRQKREAVITFKGEVKHGVEEVTEAIVIQFRYGIKINIGVNKYR